MQQIALQAFGENYGLINQSLTLCEDRDLCFSGQYAMTKPLTNISGNNSDSLFLN